MTTKFFKIFCVFFLGLLAVSLSGYGEEKQDGQYTPVYTKPLSPEPLKGALSRIIEFPFKVAKWPVDQGILFNDRHRLDKKAVWIYEESVRRGIKPLFGTVDIALMPYYGAELNLLTLAGQKDRFPDLFATATILHCPSVFFMAGSEIGVQRIGDTGFHAKGIVNYARDEKEPFYGIGPDTSMGDSTSYRMETTKVGVQAGYEVSPSIDITGGFDYRNVNIFNREHDGKGDILHIFQGQNIPGVNGNNLLDYSATLSRDTRDSKDDATQGSYQKFLFQFTDNTGGALARYFKYQLDMAKYFKLWSSRRIFITRLFAEHNDEVDHGAVPFYDMAKLGGAGTNDRDSEAMRAEAEKLMADILDKEVERQKEQLLPQAIEEMNGDDKQDAIKTWLDRSRTLFAANQYDLALFAAEKVFLYDAENIVASELIDQIKGKALKEGKADTLFIHKMYKEEIADRLEQYRGEAEDLASQGRFGQAQFTAEKILMLEPEDPKALAVLQKVLSHMDRTRSEAL